MKKNKPIEDDFTEVLFHEKNKEYGAYKLRRMYKGHVFTGLVLSVSMVVFSLTAPSIIQSLFPAPERPDLSEVTVHIDPMPLPPGVLQPEFVAPPEKPKVKDEDAAPKVVEEQPEEKKEEEKKEEEKPEPEPIVGVKKSDSASNALAGSGSKDGDPNQMFWKVDLPPSFPGGETAYQEYINEHVVYPEEERIRQKKGKVYLVIDVMKDGSIRNIKVQSATTDNFAKEAIRLFSNMPRWEPGIRNGQPVNTIVKVSISF